MWYNCKIKHQELNRSFKPVTVTEAYLVDAVSYTDAETILYQELADGRTDFRIGGIVPVKFADVFVSEEDLPDWYKCKVVYETENAKGKVKKITNIMLIQATSVADAEARIREELKNMLVPFTVEDVGVTKYLDILKGHPVEPQPVEANSEEA